MSELREYQIEYYDVANDTNDYMTIFAYSAHQAIKIFYMTTTGKYIAMLRVLTESEDWPWMH